MRKLLTPALAWLMALSQLLPIPFAAAPAWAQGQQQQQPLSKGGGGGAPSADRTLGQDPCIPIALGPTRLPPSMDPPTEWRGKYVTLYANLATDGSVKSVSLLHPSGSAALDEAAMAKVKQAWRWAPLICGERGQQFSVGVARLTCVPAGWMPAPPLTLAQPDRDTSAAMDIAVAPDGRMVEARITSGSGDAALDAALLEHVRQNWHFWPLAAGCATATRHVAFRLPETACVPKPVLQSRSLPPVAPQSRPRALDLQIGLGQDGTVLFTNVVTSSGDAGLDAAAAAHVKAAWRWEPITCKRVESYARGSALPVVDLAHIAFPAR